MNNAVITLAAVAAELLIGQRWLMDGMDHGLAAVAAIVVFGLAVLMSEPRKLEKKAR